MVVQIVGAFLSGSLALLADAAHMFTDAAALVVALVATAIAARPADDRRTYGYQRAEVLGALANGVILIALCAWVGIEAVQRLLAPAEAEVQGGLMLIVAVAGEGILEVDDVRRPLRAGQAVLVAKGTRRGITSASDPFAYLTCHRRRAGLWPAPRS